MRWTKVMLRPGDMLLKGDIPCGTHERTADARLKSPSWFNPLGDADKVPRPLAGVNNYWVLRQEEEHNEFGEVSP